MNGYKLYRYKIHKLCGFRKIQGKLDEYLEKKKDNYISELCIMQWLHSLLADWLANERNYINDPNSKNRLIAL